MATIVHEFDWPDRVVVGTIGAPGERSFYLQVRAGSRLTSVALEKEQAAVLASMIDRLLDELADDDGTAISIPAGIPDELIDDSPLDSPVEPEFRTGTMSLGWDPATAQVLIEAQPLVEGQEDDDDEEPAELLRVRIPVGSARAFAKRTIDVVRAGRPPGDE